MISVFKIHLQSLVPSLEQFDLKAKRNLWYTVEQYSETVQIRKLDYDTMTREQIINRVSEELEKQQDFAANLCFFCADQLEKLPVLTWSPQVEYNMSKALVDKGISMPEQVLLLDILNKKKNRLEWRRSLHTDSLPVVCNLPFRLREPRSEWNDFSSAQADKRMLKIKTLDGWRNTNTARYQEPLKFSSGLQFCAVQNSEIVLALTRESVLVGKFGEESEYSFAHGLEEVDFLDCFTLSTGTIVVRIGKRNALTGGLSDETFFSFRLGDTLESYTLSEEENREVEKSSTDSECFLMASTLSGWNDSNKGSSWVVYKNQQLYLSKDMVCSVLGQPSHFYAVFYNGIVREYVSGQCVNESQIESAITHAILV